MIRYIVNFEEDASVWIKGGTLALPGEAAMDCSHGDIPPPVGGSPPWPSTTPSPTRPEFEPDTLMSGVLPPQVPALRVPYSVTPASTHNVTPEGNESGPVTKALFAPFVTSLTAFPAPQPERAAAIALVSSVSAGTPPPVTACRAISVVQTLVGSVGCGGRVESNGHTTVAPPLPLPEPPLPLPPAPEPAPLLVPEPPPTPELAPLLVPELPPAPEPAPLLVPEPPLPLAPELPPLVAPELPPLLPPEVSPLVAPELPLFAPELPPVPELPEPDEDALGAPPSIVLLEPPQPAAALTEVTTPATHNRKKLGLTMHLPRARRVARDLGRCPLMPGRIESIANSNRAPFQQPAGITSQCE